MADLQLSAPVGRGVSSTGKRAVNKPEDVQKVLTMLNGINPNNGGRKGNPLVAPVDDVTLSNAIQQFQKKTYAGWSDGVVDTDRKTARDMNARFAADSPDAPPDKKVPHRDVVVHILGDLPGQPQGKEFDTGGGHPTIGIPRIEAFDQEINGSPGYEDAHGKVVHRQWIGGDALSAGDPTAAIVKFIKANRDPQGRIFIVGASRGALNALQVAMRLRLANITPDYVAAIEAFFNDFEKPELFGSIRVNQRKEDFFQALTNAPTQKQREQQGFHAAVPGFTTTEFPKQDFAGLDPVKDEGKIHDKSCQKGYSLASTTMKNLLRS
jgi:hypothetical protein